MIKTVFALGIFGTATTLSICDLCTPALSRAAAPLASIAQPALEPKTITFRVTGMTCGGCVIAVRKVLTRLEGVTKADASYEDSRAVVTYDPEKVTVEQMIAAIKTLGYEATVIETNTKP